MEQRSSEGSVFDSLAENLSERERKEFLSKIRRSLNFEEQKESRVVRQETDDEERNVRLKRDLRKLPPFRSIIFFFMGIFTGKSTEELFYRHKMKELRGRIQKRAQGMVGFETRSLKPKCPEKVFSLYLTTLPLQEFFTSVWQDPEGSMQLQEFFYRLVDSELKNEEENLFSFFPFEEIVKEYKKRGSKEDLFNELEKKVDSYIDSIPAKSFKVVEDVLKPLYFMKDLVLFPYRSFFSAFHGTLRTDEPERPPLFQSTSVVAALEELEDLYYALYNASKADVAHQLTKSWVGDVFAAVLDQSDNHGDAREGMGKSRSEQLIDDMRRLSEKVRETMRDLPLPEIIRLFREDPYYRLIVYMPKFDVVSFYRSIKKLSLRIELEEHMGMIIEHALQEERETLFEGHILKELHHYRIYSSIDYNQMGIPSFSYHNALFVMYNYLILFYKNEVQRLIQICEQIIPQQDRITRDRIVQHAASAEDVADKIVVLDDSLSEEQEEGKMFNRLRFQNSIDSEQKRLYRSLVVKKDREAKELIERGSQAIEGLKRVFKELITARERQIQDAMGRKYLFKGRPTTLKDKLQETIDRISTLQQMLNQFAKIRAEKGSDESLG